MIVGNKRRYMTPMSLYYKFVAVRGFLSSSLIICSFPKALVGEHKALSFLWGTTMIMTPPVLAQTFRSHTPSHCIHAHSDLFHSLQIFSNMRSYMNLAVVALAASSISPALPAPVEYTHLRYGNILVEF